MPAKASVQYTLRGIPSELDRVLRRKAHQKKISLNRLIIEELTIAAEVLKERKFRSLAGIQGRWKEDPAFERALKEQRPIDRGLWRRDYS